MASLDLFSPNGDLLMTQTDLATIEYFLYKESFINSGQPWQVTDTQIITPEYTFTIKEH